MTDQKVSDQQIISSFKKYAETIKPDKKYAKKAIKSLQVTSNQNERLNSRSTLNNFLEDLTMMRKVGFIALAALLILVIGFGVWQIVRNPAIKNGETQVADQDQQDLTPDTDLTLRTEVADGELDQLSTELESDLSDLEQELDELDQLLSDDLLEELDQDLANI